MICEEDVRKTFLDFFQKYIDDLDPEIGCSRFGEKKGSASDDFDKDFDFETLDGADFIESEHFLGPVFSVVNKLGFVFLDVDHSYSL